MKLLVNGQAMETVLGRLTLCKARSDAAATLSAALYTEPADRYFPNLTLAAGDGVHLVGEGGETLFSGAVHTLSYTPETVTLTAYDRGIYLARNELHGVFAGSGPEIVRAIAAALGLKVGTVDAPAAYQMLVARGGETAFSLLRQAAGDRREIAMEGEALCVASRRGPAVPIPGDRILSVENRVGIQEMVNRAVVLRADGTEAARSEHGANLRRYGQFQSVKRLSGKEGTAAAQAQGALRGRTLLPRLTVLGDWALRSGGTAVLAQPQWGLAGEFLITAVEHRCEQGLFTTALTLEEDL